MTPHLHLRDSLIPLKPGMALPFQDFQSDWDGEPVPFQAGFHLSQAGGRLQFIARCDISPDCDRSLRRGQFQSGLWERDVAEIFIQDQKTGHYREWNLSPTGAWWTQEFIAAREANRAFNANLDEARTWNHIRTGESWIAALEIPAVDPAHVRLNVCMIISDLSGERRYLSLAPRPEMKPDFHRPGDWPQPAVHQAN